MGWRAMAVVGGTLVEEEELMGKVNGVACEILTQGTACPFG